MSLLFRKFASELVKYLQSIGDLLDKIVRVFGHLNLVDGRKHLQQIYIAIEAPHYKSSQPSSFDAVECVLLVLWFLGPYEGFVNL